MGSAPSSTCVTIMLAPNSKPTSRGVSCDIQSARRLPLVWSSAVDWDPYQRYKELVLIFANKKTPRLKYKISMTKWSLGTQLRIQTGRVSYLLRLSMRHCTSNSEASLSCSCCTMYILCVFSLSSSSRLPRWVIIRPLNSDRKQAGSIPCSTLTYDNKTRAVSKTKVRKLDSLRTLATTDNLMKDLIFF